MNVKGYNIILIILSVLILIFIWSNSLAPSKESNTKSDSIVEKVKPFIDPDNKIKESTFSFFVRKTAHFLEFFLLGVSFFLLKLINKKTNTFMYLFFALSSALIDEALQSLSDRTDKITDVLLDFSGSVSGMAVTFLLVFLYLYIKKKRKIKIF